MKHKEIIILFIFFLVACGTELDVYQWTGISISNFDFESDDVPQSLDQNVTLDNYAIKVNLQYEFFSTLSNTIGGSLDHNIQSGTPIDSIHILTLNDLTDDITKDSLAQDLFFAGRDENELDSIHLFIEEFGTASNNIDTAFLFMFNDSVIINEGIHQFTIKLFLSTGDSLIATTDSVSLTN